ncbi:MAG: hypothetical protein IJV16_09155 [Lachnospiraceae bacterium]|nr:hypothetical protein [Lachnospiraceae bacterium]MBR1524116.1 hypothetical protein [Lachnospiraceae bacterium]
MSDKKGINLKGKALRTVIIAGATALIVAGLGAAGQSLIVLLGVRTVSFLTNAAGVAGGVLTVWSAADLAAGAKKQLAIASAEKKTMRLEVDPEDAPEESMTDPDTTRMRLQHIKESSQGLSGLMDRCLAQMDRMDELQRRQGDLISLNKAAYLKDTVGTLDSVEKEICLNLRGIVNQCIVAGDGADESRLDMTKVGTILERNGKLLDQSKKLLMVSADWIDEYNSKEGGADRSLLDSWIRVIQDTIRGIEESKEEAR